jgi:hypothetical protein
MRKITILGIFGILALAAVLAAQQGNAVQTAAGARHRAEDG